MYALNISVIFMSLIQQYVMNNSVKTNIFEGRKNMHHLIDHRLHFLVIE